MFINPLKRSIRNNAVKKLQNLCMSTAVQPKTDEKLCSFRTRENDPLKHTSDHIAHLYTVPPEDKKQLFTYGGLTKSFEVQTKTFNETCFMIRQPALNVINCLKSIDLSKPAVRFVLYGDKGSGKSLSLAHILHFAYKDQYLLVHVPWVGNWMRRSKEFSNSETKEGFVDLNLDAAAWLLHFKTQNVHLLSNPELRTTEEFKWTKREVTPKDSPLIEVVEHGINRVKFASDCVCVLANEIKKLSNAGVCKTLVAVDGFNAFFYPNTRVYTEKKEMVHPHKVTLTEAFLNLSKFDWKNAAVVVTVDEIAIADEDQISPLPKYLLGKDGFEHMDPFVPVQVPNYSEKELLSCMEYYRERRWVTPYPGQDDEVAFTSARNPYKLMQICASL